MHCGGLKALASNAHGYTDFACRFSTEPGSPRVQPFEQAFVLSTKCAIPRFRFLAVRFGTHVYSSDTDCRRCKAVQSLAAPPFVPGNIRSAVEDNGHLVEARSLRQSSRGAIPHCESVFCRSVSMKFGHKLSRAEHLLPDLRHNALRYKELKKLLRNVRPGAPSVTSKTLCP
jgi:hypothetical protein